MGLSCQDLDDHEGVALRYLPDNTLTSTWSAATRQGTAVVAGCACGGRGSDQHPPTEDGEAAALEQWRWAHAEPLLARQASWRRLENPAALQQVSRGLDQARGLTAYLQHGQQRPAPAREADDAG